MARVSSFQPKDAKQFSRTVRDRRHELGLSLAAVAGVGGPTEPTMVRIESGQGAPMRVSTLGKLDEALQWQKGSASAVMDGFDPKPLECNEFSGNESNENLEIVPRMTLEEVEVVELCELVGELNRTIGVADAEERRMALDECITRFEEILEPIMVRGARTGAVANSEVLNQALAKWVILRGTPRPNRQNTI